MRLKMKMVTLVLMALFVTTLTYAFQVDETQNFDSSNSFFGGGNGGTGGTGGTTTGGTTTGGTTTGGTTTGGTTTGGTTTGGTTTGGTTNGGTGGGSTGGGELGCTRTQGYWGSSPAGQQRLIDLVGAGGLTLGTVNYSASELDDILDTPAGGNALLSLAHQLIAAKLNILNGADDSQIASDIATADALIGNRVIPPVGTSNVPSNTALGQQMLQVKDRLDAYNNGQLNVPHCD